MAGCFLFSVGTMRSGQHMHMARDMDGSPRSQRPATRSDRPREIPHEFKLSRLDVHAFDVFAVVSDRFWHEKRELVTSFYAHLRDIGSVGFLATPTETVCREALLILPGVACVAGMYYRFDGALSKERWRILLHFARRGASITYAGLDVRFVWPVRHMTRYITRNSADAAFEGTFQQVYRGRHLHFTPDLATVRSTERSIQMLEKIVLLLRARSLDGLPRYMRERSLLRYNLMGPAEQDLLHDALLSALTNRTVVIRKFEVASGAAAESGVPSMFHNDSLPQCTLAGEKSDGHRPAWRRACGHAGILRYEDMPEFETEALARGRLLRSSHLSVVLLGHGAGMRTGPNPCSGGGGHEGGCEWRPADVFCVHCLGKAPRCLDIAQCRCLSRSASWCAQPAYNQTRGCKLSHARRVPALT